jgi:ABC-type multidrug transport system fused ATPase/permease subunit
MLEILDTPHEIVDHTQNNLKVTEARIDFQQVDFHYVQDKPVFTKLDLKIKPGEKVAIVGES